MRRGNYSGTIFSIDVDNKQYIISAHHLFNNVIDNAKVQIFHNSKWKDLNLRLVNHCPDPIDISVLAADIQLTSSEFICEPTSGGAILGQDLFFLGFPFGEYGDGGKFNRDFPLPFVKKATLSCIQFEKNIEILFLDGFNNPGFSGGPVVFTHPNKIEYKVCSVISSYRVSKVPIYQGSIELPIYHRENSGIIISYGIKHAVDVIKANPIGFQLSNG